MWLKILENCGLVCTKTNIVLNYNRVTNKVRPAVSEGYVHVNTAGSFSIPYYVFLDVLSFKYLAQIYAHSLRNPVHDTNMDILTLSKKGLKCTTYVDLEINRNSKYISVFTNRSCQINVNCD